MGVQPPAAAHKQRDAAVPVVPGLEGLDAFGRGLAAARQYLNREGHLTVPRKHVEELHPGHDDGAPMKDGGPVTVRLGVWLTNQKTRRTKLTAERRQTLAALGLEWAKKP